PYGGGVDRSHRTHAAAATRHATQAASAPVHFPIHWHPPRAGAMVAACPPPDPRNPYRSSPPMLDANLKTQLQAYLERLTRPVHLVASLDDSAGSKEMLELLQDIEGLSPQVSLEVRRDDAERKPSFAITSPGQDINLRFAGLPMGHEFTSLVLALLQVGGHPSKAAADVIEQVKSLEGEFRFETYFSLSCQNCPDVVQALNLM